MFRNPICPQGHDKRIVGTDLRGSYCLACKNQRRADVATANRPPAIFRNPICPNGHDKRIVGVVSASYCRACRNERQKLEQRQKRREAGVPLRNYAFLPALRYWRIEADVTQYQLSDMTGLTRVTIGELEHQRQRATLTTRQKIATALGIQPGLLVMQPPGPPKKLRAGYGPRKLGKAS